MVILVGYSKAPGPRFPYFINDCEPIKWVPLPAEKSGGYHDSARNHRQHQSDPEGDSQNPQHTETRSALTLIHLITRGTPFDNRLPFEKAS